MSLFLETHWRNILTSLVLFGLACHLKMCLSSLKTSLQIQKQDLKVRVSWRGQRGSWVLEFQFTDVLVILVDRMLLWGFALHCLFRDLG